MGTRGLRGAEFVISDAHAGPEAAAMEVLGATAQRCRVHVVRHAWAHAGERGRQGASALIATAFAQAEAEAARRHRRRVADPFRAEMPKLSGFTDGAEGDVLAEMTFPAARRTRRRSANPRERVDGEVKRRTDVVGTLPNEASIERLAGAILSEQGDEWAARRSRCMTMESMAPIDDRCTVNLPTLAA